MDEKQNLYESAVESGYEGTIEEWFNEIETGKVAISLDEVALLWKYSFDTEWKDLIKISDLLSADSQYTSAAYDIYKKSHPEYTSNKEKWISDIKQGLLKDEIFVVNFNTDGGTTIESQKISSGSSINIPKEPTKEGYSFLRWTYEETEWDFDNIISNNITLKAEWKANQYKITFNPNGGILEKETITIEHGKEYNLPIPTKEGFTFDGWYLDENFQEKIDEKKEITTDLTLYAKWVVVVTFNTNGGNEIESISGDPISIIPYDLPIPVKEGCIFMGWYLDENFTRPFKIIMPNANSTAYAKWGILEETTKIELNNWINEDSNAIDQSIDENEYITFTATPNKKEFSWVKTNINYGINDYNAIVINVIGSKGTNILVKIEGGNVSAKEEQFTLTGEEQTIIWELSENYMSKEGGQTFLFFLNPNISGCSETPEFLTIKSCSIYKIKNEVDVNKECVIFINKNNDTPIQTLFIEKNSALTNLENPTKAGYIFEGWYLDENFCDKFDFNTIINESITLYAKWNILEETTKIKLDTLLLNSPTAYTESLNEYGEKTFTSTINKDCYDWIYAVIDYDITDYNVITLNVIGTKDVNLLLKLEGGPSPVEEIFVLSGEEQTIIWTLSDKHLSKDGKLRFLLFLNPGIYGCSETPEFLTIKSCAIQKIKDEADVNKECVVFFNTNSNSKNHKELVTIGTKVTAPEPPIKTRHNFLGWYDEFGNLFDFNTIIENTITLYAKWEQIYVEYQEINLLDYGFIYTENEYNFNKNSDNSITFNKTNTSPWVYIKTNLTGKDMLQTTILKVTIQGEAGQKLIMKPNDLFDCTITCDGTLQYFEFDFSEYEIRLDKTALIIFAHPGIETASGTFTITELKLTTAPNE